MNGPTYMGRVAQLACRVCFRLGRLPLAAEVHHQRAGTGGGRRASDWRTIALCVEHHRGDTGVHGLGTKRFPRVYGVTEAELVAECWALIGVTELQVCQWEDDLHMRQAVRKARIIKREFGAVAKKPARAIPSGKTVWAKRKLESRNTLKSRPRV